MSIHRLFLVFSLAAVIAVSAAPAASAQCGGSVAVDAVTSDTVTPLFSSFTFSHTTSGSNRLLLVSVSSRPNLDDTFLEQVTSITYGGQSLTLVGAVQQGTDNARMEMWRGGEMSDHTVFYPCGDNPGDDWVQMTGGDEALVNSVGTDPFKCQVLRFKITGKNRRLPVGELLSVGR